MPRLSKTTGDRGFLTPQFGLVCLTRSPLIRYRTITRKRLLALPQNEQYQVLLGLYGHNLMILERAIRFCQAHGIFLYRIPSGLFPSWDSPTGALAAEELECEMTRIGNIAKQSGLRLVFHPDQFVVLSSDRPEVVEISCRILSRFGAWLDQLGQPRTPWAAIELHGGKGGRSNALIEVIRSLPIPIKSRLCLENDERAYGAAEILAVCKAAAIPMVFDAHHHLVKEKLDSYDHPSIQHFTKLARLTWPDPGWQMVHLSNGREFLHDPRHSDTITRMPAAFCDAPWIEVEAKAKEQAIAQLQQTWHCA